MAQFMHPGNTLALHPDFRLRNLSVARPSVSSLQRDVVAKLSRAVIERRKAICEAEDFGLTKLYNLIDDGGYADVKKLHRQLDEAVVACYGWPKSMAQNAPDIVERLTQLNKDITKGDRVYNPFPGQEKEVDLPPTESVA